MEIHCIVVFCSNAEATVGSHTRHLHIWDPVYSGLDLATNQQNLAELTLGPINLDTRSIRYQWVTHKLTTQPGLSENRLEV